MADSGCGCEKITIEATAYATTPDPIGQYAGTALLTIGGSHQSTYHADVVINPQGVPTFAEDGTIHLVFRNQISIPELASTFECYDHPVLFPVNGDPSRYTIVNPVVIFNGTGVFSGAYGKLAACGEFSMAEDKMSVVAEGRMCDLGDIK